MKESPPYNLKNELFSLGSSDGLYLWALAVIGLTLCVYPTNLNPGFPLILSGLLVLVAGFARIRNGSGAYYNYGQDAAVALLIWMCISASFFALEPYRAARSLYTFAGAVAIIVVLQSCLRRSYQMRRVTYAFLGFTSVFCLWAWKKALLNQVENEEIAALVGQFNNPDTFAVLPMLAFVLGLGVLERLPKKALLPVCGVLGFLLLTVLATGCRAALVGVGLGCFFFFALTLNFHKDKFDQTKFVLAVPMLLVFLLLPLSALNFSAVRKYAATITGQASHEGIRLEVARYGWSAALERPVFGSGPGGFGMAYQTVRPPGHEALYVNIAHNDFIEMAVETGFVGLLLWLAVLGFALRKTFRSARKGRRPFLSAGLLGALVALASYSLFNFILPERPALWVAAFVLGMAMSFPSKRRMVAEPKFAPLICGLVLVPLSLLSIYFGFRSIQGNVNLAQAMEKSESLLYEDAIQFLEAAIVAQPKRANLYVEAAKVYGAKYRFGGRSEDVEREREYLKKATELAPYRSLPWTLLAELEQREGQFTDGEAYLAKAQALIPNSTKIIVKQASLAIRKGELGRAAELLGSVVTGVKHRNYRQMKAALLQADLQQPGKAKEMAEKWLGDADKLIWMPEFLKEISVDAVEAERWQLASELLPLARKEHSSDVELQWLAATVEGKLQGPGVEFADLTLLLESQEGLQGKHLKLAFQRWFELAREQGGLQMAQEYLERQVQNYPAQAEYRLALCDIYEDAGRIKKAQNLLREGLAKGVVSAELNFRLGALYEKAGSKQLALSYYRKAISIDSGHAKSKRAISRLI